MKNQIKFFIRFGLIIWSSVVLFPRRDRHFFKPETTSGFPLVSKKELMESKLMFLLNGTIFYVLFASFDFFLAFL